MCVSFSLQLLAETFLILLGIERDIIKNLYWSSRKVSVILVRFYWNFIFLNTQLPKFRPVGAELFHVDGQT